MSQEFPVGDLYTSLKNYLDTLDMYWEISVILRNITELKLWLVQLIKYSFKIFKNIFFA